MSQAAPGQRWPHRRTRTDTVPSGAHEGGRGTSALPFALVTAIVTPFRSSGNRSIAIRKPRSCPYDISLEGDKRSKLPLGGAAGRGGWLTMESGLRLRRKTDTYHWA